MKYTLVDLCCAAFGHRPGQPSLAQNGANNLVKQAIAAEGGADALRTLKGLAIKGEAKFWEPRHRRLPAASRSCLEEATFTIDLGSRERHGAHRVGS